MRLGIALALAAYFTVPIGLELMDCKTRALQTLGKQVALAGAAMFFVGLILEW